MKATQVYFFILALIFLIFTSIQCAQRYKDEQMMKSHHQHQNLKRQNADMITVFLIPHSHDDVGWLKTVDDYFYGGQMSTQLAGVQYTIDTVVDQLNQNPSYKFSIVQVAFLYRWWNQASQTQKSQMKKLVQNGQIQFINGGWCMSDQAAPYYQDVIDQMTIGHKWLKDTFGKIPSIAWHIDPFGHQSSSASMFSRMGLQAFFFARIDYQDKNLRMDKKQLEMVWRPLQYNGDSSNYIFTHVNYYHYSPPPGFCFDVRCVDQPIKDDPTLQDYNIDVRSDKFVNYFKNMSLHFRSSNLMHTLGQDFQYISSRMWFKNIDKLIKYINQRSSTYGMTIKYSTPSQYIAAIQKQGNKYPTKTDDFFPYADMEHGYWTGYFTSRTGLKGFVRQFGRWIQATRKHLSQLKMSNSSNYISANSQSIQNIIWNLQMAQGILQHHDAIAGTSKQKVAFDYIDTGLRSIKRATQIYSKVKSEEINKQIGQTIQPQSLYFNVFWNETAKFTGIDSKLSNNQIILLNLYNPGAKGLYQIKVNVRGYDLKIFDINNQLVQGDVICPNTINNSENCELIFNLVMEQSSNNYVKIMRSSAVDASAKIVELVQFRIVEKNKDFTLTSNVSLTITRNNQQFDLKIGSQQQTFFVGYKYYQNYQGSGQRGGAYIFRPANDTPKTHSLIRKIYYLDGTQSLVIVMQGTTTLTKLYFSKKPNRIQNSGVQVQTFLQSINIDDGVGKQIVMSIITNYQNNQQFYTDSNGLQQQYRKLNYRPTWNLTVNQAVAGNYYPINSHIRIRDTKTNKNLSVLTERSIGGSVINPGQIELMIHRRLVDDDWRGVDEPLNQTEVINGNTVGLTQSLKHFIVFGNKYREVQKVKDQKIMITFAKSQSSQFSKNQIRLAPFKVPDNVKLYLRPFSDNSYLLRLHNMNSQQWTDIQIPDGWTTNELTLNANQQWSEWKSRQYKWNEESAQEKSIYISDIEKSSYKKLKVVNKLVREKELIRKDQHKGSSISLKPFDIRTFRLVKN